jgi:hypothetical protein
MDNEHKQYLAETEKRLVGTEGRLIARIGLMEERVTA